MRSLYILDATASPPVVRRRFDATGLSPREVHEMEKRIRREHPEIDDVGVFLRSSDFGGGALEDA